MTKVQEPGVGPRFEPGPWVSCRKCGDRIRSEHVHHMKRCGCGAIAVDGGNHYLRLSAEDLDDILYDNDSETETP